MKRCELIVRITPLILTTLLLVGCTTIMKTVNMEEIKAHEGKVFQLGIVMVCSECPIGLKVRLDKNLEALERMPIEEICSVLRTEYNIEVDTRADHTTKTLWKKYPYWGKSTYVPDRTRSRWPFAGGTIQDENEGCMVYIAYAARPDNKGTQLPWSLKETFYYDVLVKSDETVLLHLWDPIEVIDMPKKKLIIDFAGYWDEMVAHVDTIPEALKRGIEQQREEITGQPAP